MKASKTLGKPENWQDFESLCKKLWGEIWQCPEIKKNGRTGQNQNGVDVYGIPSFDDDYYGIQCKGKDEYTHKQLTVKEIDDEIKKAKTFEPKLKKLYFVTTAVKDAEIEKIIRLKNIEHKKLNQFEVHIFSWEDIVDLIEENQDTYNYYVNSISFKSINSVSVTFQDNTTEITIAPKFKKRIIHFEQNIIHNLIFENPMFGIMEKQKSYAQLISVNFNNTEINNSFGRFFLKIQNTGTAPIEDFKIFLEFEGEIIKLSETNEKTRQPTLNIFNKIYTTYLYSESMTGKLIPRKNILVGDDTFTSENIFLKPTPKESKILIKWKLISKSFKQEGNLLINVKPDIQVIQQYIIVEDKSKVGIKEYDIEDDIIEKK